MALSPARLLVMWAQLLVFFLPPSSHQASYGGDSCWHQGSDGQCSSSHSSPSWPDEPAPQWLPQYHKLHSDIVAGRAPPRFAVFSCRPLNAPGSGVSGPWPASKRGVGGEGFHGCTGYGNRLLGLATVFLYSVMTPRAFLIDWPGPDETQLSRFFSPQEGPYGIQWGWRPELESRFKGEGTLRLDDRLQRSAMRRAFRTANLTELHPQACLSCVRVCVWICVLLDPKHV